MLQIRPTFSESWYRVAGLKAKLRTTAQISRQHYRGERWYVVRDPAGNQFHRLSDAAYRFVGLLDGTRTVEEAWDLVGGQLADDAPTQPEVIHILSQLHGANLLEANVTPDSAVLLRRHKQQRKQKWQQRAMNMLFPRIPLWDPDRFLKRWMPVADAVISKLGAIVWLVVVIAAIALLAPEWPRLRASASDAIAPGNWPFLWATFVLIKLIHELGHAFICRKFGGEVHELGIMFLVLIPAPYVDASTAWAFPQAWKRVLVGAGGMISELFFAALMAFVWAYTAPGELINQLAYNAMLIASVSTIIFNGNPLLRYDGYYILSDWLQIPNLRQRSVDYSLGLIKRHVFRVKEKEPLPPPMQRVWLLSYAICSSIYRIFIGIMIILLVAFKVPILGMLMAIGGVVTWAVVPVVKVGKYLLIEPELHRKRGRAIGFSAAVLAAVIILVGLIRFPVHIDANGIVEPGTQRVLTAGWGGFVADVLVKDGQRVHEGDVLMILKNVELDSAIAQKRDELRSWQAKLLQATMDDPAARAAYAPSIAAIQQQYDELLRRKELLTIKAPIAGRVLQPKLHEMDGQFVHQGQEVLTVAQTNDLLVKANVDQKDAELAAQYHPTTAEVRLAGYLSDEPLKGTDLKFIDAAQDKLAHASLGQAGGGSVQVDPRDPSGEKPLVQQFELRLRIDNPDGKILPGQRSWVRCTLTKKPLIWQWSNRFWQLLMAENNGRWM